MEKIKNILTNVLIIAGGLLGVGLLLQIYGQGGRLVKVAVFVLITIIFRLGIDGFAAMVQEIKRKKRLKTFYTSDSND